MTNKITSAFQAVLVGCAVHFAISVAAFADPAATDSSKTEDRTAEALEASGHELYFPKITTSVTGNIFFANNSQSVLTESFSLFNRTGPVCGPPFTETIPSYARKMSPVQLTGWSGSLSASGDQLFSMLAVSSVRGRQRYLEASQAATSLVIPRYNWRSVITLRNVSDTKQGNVKLRLFNTEGGRVRSVSAAIAPNARYTFEPQNVLGSLASSYTARIEADTAIAGIEEIKCRNHTLSLPAQTAASAGTKVYLSLPGGDSDHEGRSKSNLYIQNTGSDKARTMISFFTPEGANVANFSGGIKPGGFAIVNASAKVGPAFRGFVMVAQNRGSHMPLLAQRIDLNESGNCTEASNAVSDTYASKSWLCAAVERKKSGSRYVKIINPERHQNNVTVSLKDPATGETLIHKTYEIGRWSQEVVDLTSAAFKDAGKNFSGPALIEAAGHKIVVNAYGWDSNNDPEEYQCQPVH